VRNNLLLFLSVILLLPACKNSHVAHSGIQKRKYTKGYHVSLGGKKRQRLPPKVTSEPVTQIPKKDVPMKEAEQLLASGEEARSPAVIPQDAQRIYMKRRPVKKRVTEIFNKRFHKKDPQPPDEDEPSESLARLSLILAVAGAVLSAISIVIQVLSVTADIAVLAMAQVGALALLAGLVISIIALFRIRRHPECYGGKGYAKAALIIAGIILVASIGYAIYDMAVNGFL